MLKLTSNLGTIHRRIPKGILSLIVCAAFALQALQEVDYYGFWRNNGIWRWDRETYYHYLPATFIYGDVGDLAYVGRIDRKLRPDGEAYMYGISVSAVTGRNVIKCTYGTALFELPGFLIAHAYASSRWSIWEANGYSLPYQLAVPVSTILFVFLGLLVLRRFMLLYCGDPCTAMALCALSFGTNLWCYSTVEAGMCHGYQFFLFAVVIVATDRWHRRPSIGAAAVVGAAIGWIIVVRPVDGLIALVPFCWDLWPGAVARTKWDHVVNNPKHVILGIVAAIVFAIPQLAYWKYTTGSYLFYSYGGEAIHLGEPHVIDGLFSFRKGWFVYSPLALMGMTGLWLMVRNEQLKAIGIASLSCLVPLVYVVFCWWQWWYGGGFGCRPLVPALALLALPIAAVAERLFARKWTTIAAVLVVYLGVSLNLFQTRQYHLTLIHWADMTFERYETVWGVGDWDELDKEDVERMGQ
ncbi:MAG: hypothetical protein WAU70_10495 [Flavobacteriales bacterium]